MLYKNSFGVSYVFLINDIRHLILIYIVFISNFLRTSVVRNYNVLNFTFINMFIKRQ